MKKQRVKEEAETEGRPSLPPGDPRAEKSARMQTFTPSRSPSLPLPHSTHSRSHFNNHNTVGRTDGQGEEEEAIWSVDRPSLRPSFRFRCPPPSVRNGLSRGAAPLGEGAPRLLPRGGAEEGTVGGGDGSGDNAFLLRKEVPEQRSGREGRKEGNLARLHSLLMHSQSVTKLQGIEEQQ